MRVRRTSASAVLAVLVIGLASASVAAAAPVHPQTAISHCTKQSATAPLGAADAPWLGKTVDCMYSDMLHQQACGTHPRNGSCRIVGGEAVDLIALAQQLLPQFIRARSGARVYAIAAAASHRLRLPECPGGLNFRWRADDSAGPQSTSPTLSAAANELKSGFFAHGSTGGFFGAAVARGEIATGGQGTRTAVSYLVVSITCK